MFIHTHTHSHLARMEVDTVHVVKRIVALLVDSFQPENVSPSQQVREREREKLYILSNLHPPP